MATQNNAIRSNYVKAKIDNTQQNSECILRRDKDETVNRIIKANEAQMKQTSTRGIQHEVSLSGQGDPLGIVQDIRV